MQYCSIILCCAVVVYSAVPGQEFRNQSRQEQRPHFYPIGQLVAPVVLDYIILQISEKDIMHHSNLIEEGLRQALISITTHPSRGVVQVNARASKDLERTLRHGQETHDLIFGEDVRIVKLNRNISSILTNTIQNERDSKRNVTRVKRQLSEILSASALALAAYNTVQIESIKKRIEAVNYAFIDMGKLARKLNSTLFTVSDELVRAKHNERFQIGVKAYHSFWSELEKTYLAAAAGNLVPALRLGWVQKSLKKKLNQLADLADKTDCRISRDLETLLSFPTTASKSSAFFEVVIPLPCISGTPYDLYHWNQKQAIQIKDTENVTRFYSVRTNERYIAIDTLTKDYIVLSNSDLSECMMLKHLHFCEHIQRISLKQNNSCMSALWEQNPQSVRRLCDLQVSKGSHAIQEKEKNHYFFHPPTQTTVICEQSNITYYPSGLSDIWLGPGCNLTYGQNIRILRLSSASITFVSYHPSINKEFAILELPFEIDGSAQEVGFWQHSTTQNANHVLTMVVVGLTLMHCVILVVTIANAIKVRQSRAKRNLARALRQEARKLEMEQE